MDKQINQQPTRERCQMCHRISSVGFYVKDEIWKAAVHPRWQSSVLCLSCFVSQADEKMIDWDEGIKFYPVSLRTHLDGNEDELRYALEESIKLQSHYAQLLNQYDGGIRLVFPNAEAWLERLKEIKS